MLHFLSKLIVLSSLFVYMTAFAKGHKQYTVSFTVNHGVTDKVLYQGSEDVSHRDGKIYKTTKYFDLNEKLSLEEEAIFTEENIALEFYSYHNHQNGAQTIAKRNGQKISISYREGPESQSERGTLEWKKNSVHGRSFHEVILRDWQKLVDGLDTEFSLMLLYRFKSVDFRISPINLKNAPQTEPKHYHFALEPSNFFIRQFVPEMTFVYSGGKEPKIISFTGPTGLLVDGKQEQKVVVKFKYQ